MRFLVDAQLPPALARCIERHGHLATHVMDHSMADALDGTIWDFAIAMEAVILTKDEDFAARRIRGAAGPSIIWLRWPNMKRRDLVNRLELILPSIIKALESGESLIEAV